MNFNETICNMRLVRDFIQFLWSVLNSWAGYSTGGLIVALVALWSTLRQTVVGRRLGIALTVLFLLMAVFSAWEQEKTENDQKSLEIDKLNKEISDLTRSSISAEIDFAVVGGQPTGSHAGIIVSLRNLGAPSAIAPSSWELIATTQDGKRFTGWPNTLKDKNLDFCLQPNKVLRIVRSDALYLKTSSPIDRNGYQQGFLWFGFPDLDRIILVDPTTKLSLSATSVTGQRFATSITISELAEKGRSSTKFFSGIQNPSPLDLPCKENQPY